MFIVAIVSVSGGVGKTMLAANLATVISNRGRPVLAVEWDPANRLGLHLGVGGGAEDGWISAKIRGDAWQETACRNSDDVDFLPFGPVGLSELIKFEQQLVEDPLWLSKQLRAIELPEESVVLIDVAKGPSIYLRQALAAADGGVAVMMPTPSFGLEIDALQAELKARSVIVADELPVNYLLNHVDPTRLLAADIVSMLRVRLDSQLLRYMIHRDEAIPEALASNLAVTEYAPDAQASHDLQGLAAWLLGESSVLPDEGWL